MEGLEARLAAGEPLGHVAQRGQLLREPHRQRGGRAPRRSSSRRPPGRRRRASRASWARWRSPTPSSPTRATSGSSHGPRWEALAAKGAQTQRVLWASTGTKNPQLLGRALRGGADRPGYREHGAAGHPRRLPRSRPAAGQPGRGRRGGAGRRWRRSRRSGISLAKVTDDLLAGRAQEVRRPLHEAPEGGRAALPRRPTRRASTPRPIRSLPPSAAEVAERLKAWDAEGGTRRLFAGDASLWTGTDEAQLARAGSASSEPQLDDLAPLLRIREEVGSEGLHPRRCSWAWAAPASARRSGRRRSAASPAIPSCSSSTPRIPRRSGPSRTRWTSRARSSSWPASRAPPSSPTSSRPTSSISVRRLLPIGRGPPLRGRSPTRARSLEKEARGRRLPADLRRA